MDQCKNPVDKINFASKKMNLAELILPKGLLDYFKAISLEVDSKGNKIDIYLEELSIPPTSDYTYSSKGFTEARILQDFPIRGKAVYLQVIRGSQLVAICTTKLGKGNGI